MRRRDLIAGAATLAALSVTGCLGGGDGAGTDRPSDSPTNTSSDTPTETPTRTPTETPTRTPTPDPPAPGIENGSFEDGLSGWTVGKDLPEVPGGTGPVDSTVEVTSERARTGSKALLLSIDGRADDGTVWVEQEADLSGYDTLSVAVYSEQASFNTRAQVAAYCGPAPEDGLVEADFDRSNAADGHDGWTTFEYPVESDGPGLVAVGTNVVWETTIVSVLDEVMLS